MCGEMLNVHKILVWIPEGKLPICAWRRWNGNTEIVVEDIWYRDVYFMQLFQHRDKCRKNTTKKN